MVGEIISERWATSNRNGGRDHSGIVGDIERNQHEKVHSLAFRALEPLICDCVSMAKIAADEVMSIRTENREAVFAVAHAYEMLDALKKDYYAMWRGGKRRDDPRPDDGEG
jgi:hypothetical protein